MPQIPNASKGWIKPVLEWTSQLCVFSWPPHAQPWAVLKEEAWLHNCPAGTFQPRSICSFIVKRETRLIWPEMEQWITRSGTSSSSRVLKQVSGHWNIQDSSPTHHHHLSRSVDETWPSWREAILNCQILIFLPSASELGYIHLEWGHSISLWKSNRLILL
jgi:hypothetical protein